MRKKMYIFLVVLTFLSSCTAYVDTRREAGSIENIGQSTQKVVALCYNPIFDDEEQQKQTADEACAPKKAIFKDTKYFNCTLLYPNTAFYECE